MQWAKRVNLMGKLRVFYHTLTVFLAAVCVLAALYPDDSDDLGFYGALVVFLFTTMVAIESIKEKPPKKRGLPALIWTSLLAGAYLILASEDNAHPLDREWAIWLAIVWLLAAVIAFAWLPVVLHISRGK